MPSGSSIHISIKPQGSVAGFRITGTPAAASLAWSARTSRTWIQIMSERPGRAGRVPGDFEESWAEEEHHPGIFRGAELPVDGQAQDVAVEAVAAVQIAGAQHDPAAQNVHSTIPAARWVARSMIAKTVGTPAGY